MGQIKAVNLKFKIKMTSLHTIFLAVLYFVSALFPSQACNNRIQTKSIAATLISKISYTSTGGRSGNYETMNISADSIIYVQGHRGAEKTIKEKTLKSVWTKLTKAVNLRDFDQIKSNPGHALYDGIDITIAIETGQEKHSIVNGNEDTVNYKRISPFTDLLENKLAQLRKKISW